MTAAELSALLDGDVVTAARGLLGARLRTDRSGSTCEVMLTEVEAYAGESDPASHAYRGQTARNQSMFRPSGTLYVYRSYGIHWCMNIVVGEPGTPHAVLLRGGVPTAGADEMARRRGRSDHLADGPGKLCEALNVRGEDDGTSVFDGPVQLALGELPADVTVAATPRIGISKAVDLPWRFVAEGPSADVRG